MATLRLGAAAVLLGGAVLLSGCGGGGSSGGAAPAPPAPPPPPTPPAASEPTQAEVAQASRFVARASFGMPYDDIVAVARQGPEAWLEAQFQLPASTHVPIIVRYGDEYGYDFLTPPFPGLYPRFAFFENAMLAPDQLRQRVAYALTQIFVVSGRVEEIGSDPAGLASYYDMLLEHAFGNFRDLLRAVTLHPVMGLYLSHVNNAKSDPVANTFPDENYAREVMQLFSIGLFELNPDGTLVRDGSGQPVPTYDNGDIREFSRIFTGLTYGADVEGNGPFFGRRNPVLYTPMVMLDAFHEEGEKRLLNGVVVPAGQTGIEDLDDAIDNLFQHPNVGPFIGRLLIQRLVKSNPSPAYVARVAEAFAGDGQTPRGDMRAVLRAILLDPEALVAPELAGAGAGKVREPFLRWLQMHHAIGHTTSDGTYPVVGSSVEFLTGQHVLRAPSVFNFYLPIYAPPGPVSDAGLVAPELQIVTDSTVVGWANLVASMLFGPTSVQTPEGFAQIGLDLLEWEALASDPEALLDRIDAVLTYGTMSDATRQSILTVLEPIRDDPGISARVALYLALVSPDYVVEL
ncbi:MAG: DUF1800 domain-containing protein [Pseudomonadales bacterium]|jgi:uncharacterized protein (DUF1800 family)|nr:DUF1800 domain-containing protein [Pseudomonadales bacterium]